MLLHAGSSGVGQAAMQLAKTAGLTAFVTCRSDEKVEFCLKLGAKGGVNTRTTPSFGDTLKEMNGGEMIDVILDCVGASYANENAACK